MKWKDYKYGSWLVIAFGLVDANVIELGSDATDTPNHFGIIVHPFQTVELTPGSGPGGSDPTWDDAKAKAEEMLRSVILPAAEILKGDIGR